MSYTSDYNKLFSRTLSLFPYKVNGKANPNSQQMEIIKRLISIRDGGGIIIKSSTGSGKTVASLSSMMARADFSKDKLLIVVRTISQMDPIIREWSRIIGGYDGIQKPNTPNVLPILGKSKCCKMKQIMQNEFKASPEALSMFCKIHPCEYWPGHPKYKQIVKRKPAYLMRKLNMKLAAVAFNSTKSPVGEVPTIYRETVGCGYYMQSEMLRYAKIIIVTYAHLNDSNFERLRKEANLKLDNLMVMVDEAHNLSKLSETIITEDDINLVKALVGNTRIFQKLSKLMKSKGVHESDEIASDYEWEYATELLSPEKKDVLKLHLSLQDFVIPEVVKVKSFIAQRSQGILKSELGKLTIIEATPAKKLFKLNHCKLVIFQSGTINIEDYRRLFGMPYLEGLETSSNKLDNKYKCYLGSGGYTSKMTRRTPQQYKQMAKAILHLHQYSPRHTLVVCPSYDFKSNLQDEIKLQGNGTKIVIEEKTSTTAELTTAIKYAREKVLIVAVSKGKMNEGTEVVKKGNSLLSLVILAGLSFAPPRDDRILIQKELIKATKKTDVQKYEQDLGLMQEIDQAFGRAVRTDQDRGFLVILDYRAKRYAEKLDLKTQNNMDQLTRKITRFFEGYQGIDSLN